MDEILPTNIYEDNSLCVFIPVFNEVTTIHECLQRVLKSKFVQEVIIVDDCSTDGSKEYLLKFDLDDRVTVILNETNLGKGAALQKALTFAVAPLFIVQDADLEYNPADFEKLLRPIFADEADVVFGSRFVGGGERRILRFWHTMGNKVLTLVSNCFSNLYLTDMATCYKCFRTQDLRSLNLRENRFGIDPEITMKIARKRLRIVEVGVSYSGRSYDEGKKIGLKDAFRHLYCILVYRFK